MEKSEEEEELQDFLVNFKFPWEEESSVAVHKPVRKVSRDHTLSDTTPARRAKRISGKVLLSEFSDVSSDQTGINPKPDLNEEPHHDDTPDDDITQEANSVTKANDNNQLTFLQSGGSWNKQKNRRQSSLYKRRESIALLKTIGEILSPEIAHQSQQSSLIDQSALLDCPSSGFSNVKPVNKQKVKTFRRRSSRLSGIMAPLLELGKNGLPKLLSVEEEETVVNETGKPEKSVRIPQGTPEHRDFNLGLRSVAGEESGISSPQLHSGASSAENSLTADVDEPSTVCKVPSTSTPHGKVTHGMVEFEQCATPQALKLSTLSFTPDQRMLNSFDSLRLQSELVTPTQGNADETEGTKPNLQYSRTPEDPVDELALAAELKTAKSPQYIVNAAETQMLPPEETVSDDHMETPGESISAFMTDVDKENLEDSFGPSDEQNKTVEFDDKVKDFYLKKGQTAGKKKRNTNLETVFEELMPEDAGKISKRKYRRSIAFPEKPWEARKGSTKAKKKVKKKRMSLSKVAKKQDSLLQNRLTTILQELAEEV